MIKKNVGLSLACGFRLPLTLRSACDLLMFGFLLYLCSLSFLSLVDERATDSYQDDYLIDPLNPIFSALSFPASLAPSKCHISPALFRVPIAIPSPIGIPVSPFPSRPGHQCQCHWPYHAKLQDGRAIRQLRLPHCHHCDDRTERRSPAVCRCPCRTPSSTRQGILLRRRCASWLRT